MQYDKIKQSLGKVFNSNPFLRKCFYALLDLLLLRAWHIKKELRRIKKILPADAFVLDAGAGFGQYTYYMSKLGRGLTTEQNQCRNVACSRPLYKWQIKAIDVKAEQIDDCNHFFAQIGKSDHVKFELADLTTFCEPDKYHLAIAIDVMEHIHDDVAVFRNIYASLKPNGILLISTPSDGRGYVGAGLVPVLTNSNHHNDSSFIDEHVRDGYNINEIQNKLSEIGFTKIDAQYTYGRPGRISWLLSMKYPMLMLGITKLFFILLPVYYAITFPFCLLLNWWDVSTNHKSGTGLKVKAVK